MNWQRWIKPGIAATMLMALLAIFLRSGSIGADLSVEVNARLAAEGQGWADAHASGRDVTIRGTAPTPESQQAAVRLAEEVRGVRVVSDRSDLLALASPYEWSAKRVGRTVTLGGAIPSEGSRTAVLAAARRAMANAEIVDEMAPARGAPKAFSAATTFALNRLAEMSDGTVTLTDATLVVNGTAANGEAYAALRRALRDTMPATIGLGPVELQPPRADRFVWSADYDGTAVTISGFVPNEIVKQSLVAAVKATLPDASITDQAVIASGDPPGFAEAAAFGVTLLDRLSRGGITLDGLTLDVGGSAKSVDDYEKLLERLGGPLPADVRVVAAEVMPAPATDYGWKAERAAGGVALIGYVPRPENRTEIVALAKSLFGDAIDDRVRVASGEPRMDWIGAVKFSLSQLALLATGSVAVGEKTYSIAGTALSSDTYVKLLDVNAHKLPAGLELAEAAVEPPHVSPYRFTAERKGTGLVVTGNVASEADRQEIVSAGQRKFGAATVSETLSFGGGAPDGFHAVALAALQAVSRLAGGHVAIIDKAVTISGTTYYPAAVSEIVEALRGDLPEGYTLDAGGLMAPQDGQTVTADNCRDMLQGALRTGAIAFNGTKADLTEDSVGVLDRVSAILARCPSAGVEIGAHSDSDGSEKLNLDLTQARAEAIEEHLVVGGVRRERLTAVGYGEANPVADNDTAAGKAANRRIEFTVTEAARG